MAQYSVVVDGLKITRDPVNPFDHRTVAPGSQALAVKVSDWPLQINVAEGEMIGAASVM
jgi:hypothetical protein